MGYKEVGEYLGGQLEFEELKPKIIISTMQLAKRQMTWFRKVSNITWFQGPGDIEKILPFVRSQLAGPT